MREVVQFVCSRAFESRSSACSAAQGHRLGRFCPIVEEEVKIAPPRAASSWPQNPRSKISRTDPSQPLYAEASEGKPKKSLKPLCRHRNFSMPSMAYGVSWFRWLSPHLNQQANTSNAIWTTEQAQIKVRLHESAYSSSASKPKLLTMWSIGFWMDLFELSDRVRHGLLPKFLIT